MKSDEGDAKPSQPERAGEMSYEQLREQAAAAYERARVATRDWERELRANIRQKPIKSLLVAVGVGFIAGAILGRRR